jgi:plasmid stabilization system protein ParE
MSGYLFTPQAANDLVDILTFIASNNSDAADRVEAEILEACDLLADSPFAGRARKDLTSLPVRFGPSIPTRTI